MVTLQQRRTLLKGAALVSAAMISGGSAEAASAGTLPGGAALTDLTKRLAAAPRRRTFKTVPMILTDKDQWDNEALDAVLRYKPAAKQAWDVTDIGGPWLNGVRNSLNAQVWSFGHKDFLAVCAIHGAAQFSLYDQAMWDKYDLSKLAGAGFPKNTLIDDKPAASANPTDFQSDSGVFSGQNNSIPALQRRGVVMMSCHNAIWEQATRLKAAGTNPDKLDVPALAAELTNHLVPGVVLIPGAVATLPELQRVGFAYVR